MMLLPAMRRFRCLLLALAAWPTGATGLPAQSAEWTRVSSEVMHSAPRITHERQIWRSRDNGDDTVVELVRFQPTEATFRVVDQGSEGDQSLASVMRNAGAVAGINGGYFHPDRRPLGLLVANGVTLHPEERARLLSGVLLVFANHSIKLQRVDEPRPKMAVRDAIQAGPFLVDGGQAVSGLEAKRAARRSVVATDSAGHWAILIIEHATLAESAILLSTPGVLGEGKSITRALNLDGGSSTGLWVKGPGGGSPHYSPEFGTVRDFLAVFPR